MRVPSCQRGQETLQAIFVVSFVLLPVLFATLELAGLLHQWNAQQSAAAIGARIASERGAYDPTVRTWVTNELVSAGVDRNCCDIEGSPAWVGWHEPITVRVSARRHVGIPFLFQRDVELAAAATGRGELNH